MTKGKNIPPKGQRGGGEGARSTPALRTRTASQNKAFTQPYPRLEKGKATDTPCSCLIFYGQRIICPSLHTQRRAKEGPVLLDTTCINIYKHTWVKASPGGKKFRKHQGEHHACVLCACLQLVGEPWTTGTSALTQSSRWQVAGHSCGKCCVPPCDRSLTSLPHSRQLPHIPATQVKLEA